LKRQLNLNPLTRTLVQVFLVSFLAFILPGWNFRPFIIAQVDPTTDIPEPTKVSTTPTPLPQPTGDTGGIGPAAGQWVRLMTESFEGVFPTTGWTVQDLRSDSFERFWDDDGYRPHPSSYWAAWPANGGAHKIYPTLGNDNYPNNLDTRMIYGPFDLSDAFSAYTDFYLWRELESCCDYLAFELSHDGVTFEEKNRWSTTSKVWEAQRVYYYSYLGDSSVWIAWRFYSNSSITYDGPWVDDIEVWKFISTLPTATTTTTRTLTRTPTHTPTRTPTRTLTPGLMIPRVYLPVVSEDYPLIKTKSGIHLGNRPSANPNENDWNIPVDYLARLKGTTQGDWPAAIVVLSNQIYTIHRYPSSQDSQCNIQSVTVKNQYAFDYLKQAAQAGSKIVIRIYPSPGNFTDAVQVQTPSSSHDLLTGVGQTPEDNRGYCNPATRNEFGGPHTGNADEFYRSIDDVAKELQLIHTLNASDGIAAQEFFLPANESNLEWYENWYNHENILPRADNSEAWIQMNSYFSNLYDYAKGLNNNIRILTPTMGQEVYAERIVFRSCQNNVMIVNDQPAEAAGYDFMENTYRYKNDGLAWHNYWFQGKEFWSDTWCAGGNQTSHHVAQYFPTYLADEVVGSGKPTFILEADLLSPCQQALNPIQNKDVNNGEATSESLWRFVQQERGAKYIAAWLLTEKPHFPPNCGTEPSEIAWHEAYRDTGMERDWFRLWWLRDE